MARIRDKMTKISDATSMNLNPTTVDLMSNKEALICGCRGIIEYDEKTVKVNCGNIIICFKGIELSIQALTIDEIAVTGEIIKIEFSNC